MKGNDLIVTSGDVIYASKSCEVNTEAETIETAESAQWRTYLAGRKGWTVSVSYLVASTKWRSDLLRVGQKVKISLYERSGSTPLGGYAIITKCNITATRGNLAQGSLVFLGTGELEEQEGEKGSFS